MATSDGAEPGGAEHIAEGLGALEPRAWAHLLRALRRSDVRSAGLDPLLGLPTSELADGARRSDLTRLLSTEPAVLSALLEDPALPAAAHRAIVLGMDEGIDADARSGAPDRHAHEDVAGVSERGSDERDEYRAVGRWRELRRELVELRRQRDGAEARAAVAEARAAESRSALEQSEHDVGELEAELARTREEVAQAVARTERRSAVRIAELERSLAAERGTLDALRRASERDRVTLDGLRVELEDLRTRPSVGVVVDEDRLRPLVLPDELEPGTTAAARWLLDGADALLVDGYNVTLALHAGHPLNEQRRWLIDRLRPLVTRGRTAPVVVFDGDGQGISQRDPSGVEVRFTASGIIADDEIVFAVAATDDPVLVITDDVDLQARVRAEGGNVLGTVHLLGAIDG